MSWYIFSVPGKPQGKGRPRASVVAGQPLSFTKTGYGNAGSKGSKVSAFPAP